MGHAPNTFNPAKTPVDGRSVNVTLPDNSIVRVDRQTLRFHSVDPVAVYTNPAKRAAMASTRTATEVEFTLLIGNLAKPPRSFSDCFWGGKHSPCYEERTDKINIKSILTIFSFPSISSVPRVHHGGTIGLATTKWYFLDGGITCRIGYGFGSHSWTIVEGAEAVRALCLFFGIQQPERITGEPPRRALSLLLEDMTYMPD